MEFSTTQHSNRFRIGFVKCHEWAVLPELQSLFS